MVCIFSRTQSENLEILDLDHRPVITRIHTKVEVRIGKFWFDKRWCCRPEVIEVVNRVWNRHSTLTTRSLTERISDCRKEVSRWKRNAGVNSKTTIRKLRNDLDLEASRSIPDF